MIFCPIKHVYVKVTLFDFSILLSKFTANFLSSRGWSQPADSLLNFVLSHTLPLRVFFVSVKFFRMKFLEYSDTIEYGDLVILYISTEDLKQITVTKDQTYQTKFG